MAFKSKSSGSDSAIFIEFVFFTCCFQRDQTGLWGVWVLSLLLPRFLVHLNVITFCCVTLQSEQFCGCYRSGALKVGLWGFWVDFVWNDVYLWTISLKSDDTILFLFLFFQMWITFMNSIGYKSTVLEGIICSLIFLWNQVSKWYSIRLPGCTLGTTAYVYHHHFWTFNR